MDVGKGRELGAEALPWVGSGLDIVVRDAIKGLPVWNERAVGFYGVDGILVNREGGSGG